MHRVALLLLLLLVPLSARAQEHAMFDADEVRKILALGPWPLPTHRDPSNRLSGNSEAAAFGRALFFDEGLSRFGALACASCHKPDKAWSDGRARASAAAALDRNTPALFNLRHMSWFGWDGGADSLWMQSIRPLLDPREMAAPPEHIKSHIAGKPAYRATYRRLMGVDPAKETAERVTATVAKALAAFQETLTSGRTPFDDARDAIARRNSTALDAYPGAAQRGLKLFVGRGQCTTCHSGPLLTNGHFYDMSLESTGGLQGATTGRIDTGRPEGIGKLTASPYSRLGAFSDDPRRRGAATTRAALSSTPVPSAFRVPSLRNVALTSPYMHNGSKATLADAVRHYPTLAPGQIRGSTRVALRPIALSESDIADLVAFLQTLTEIKPR